MPTTQASKPSVYQLPACDRWSTFFQTLPHPYLSRVKSRDAICNVRILTNDETGGPLSVKIFSTHGEEASHTHYETKQIFTILDGELTVWSAKKGQSRIEQTLMKGQTVCIQPGELHGFRGTALVGGVDIGKGTTLDTYEEHDAPKTICAFNPPQVNPITQGTVSIQTPSFEQRDLISNDPNFRIRALTASGQHSYTPESTQVAVIISGSTKIASTHTIQTYQSGDYLFMSKNNPCTILPETGSKVIMIVFTMP